VVHVDAVDQHLALIGRIELLDELGQGGLARARMADNAQNLAGLDGKRNVFQDVWRAWPVAEGDIS
jgi:hypothetical protein